MDSIIDIQKLKGNTVLACLANGLSERDALVLAEWSVEDFANYKKINDRFAGLVERKKVEYKETLMKPITESIRKGDAKLAQWMLERQFQGEFSSKTRKDPNEDANPIGVVINMIQNGREGSTLLPRSSVVRDIVAEAQESSVGSFSTPTPIIKKKLRDFNKK